ncbi:Peroxiredoxin [Mycena kentingensis (nom. inval.)]|nr:Peroxiredoxin [Mycena kentingensis (nom. inval.)]
MSAISEALRLASTVATSIGHGSATIEPGGKLPTTPLKENKADSSAPLEYPAGKHIIIGGLIGVLLRLNLTALEVSPGHSLARGVEQISVVAVNDVFVLQYVLVLIHVVVYLKVYRAWKEKLAPSGTPIRFFSDDSGAFSKALGLHFDATPVLGGVRAKRFVIIANGAEVETVAVEEVASQLTVTDAKAILAQLA